MILLPFCNSIAWFLSMNSVGDNAGHTFKIMWEKQSTFSCMCLETKESISSDCIKDDLWFPSCGTEWWCQWLQISSSDCSSQALGEHLLSFLLIIYFASFLELNPTSGSIPSTTPMSPSSISTQNLVMSSSGVGGDASVTLTLADTQGMLSGGLDTVTLNITSQVSVLQRELWKVFMNLFFTKYIVLFSH